MKAKKIVMISTSVIAVIVVVLWQIGLIGLWTEGMAYIANNTKEFTDTKGHIVQGEYSIPIDLSDLESNIGKELYNDGAYRIYVSWIDHTGSINSGGYQIGFRSSGSYSLSNASLISGAHHATVNGNSFTTSMSARMTASYNGKHYTSSVSGLSGLNYKDGDYFSFYIFPSESYENQEISLNETGIVLLTVSDLYKNVWSKKA
ncbi:hypothetical protein [Paenibacillus spongiae]|uniref:Uncharacterized protein n=1 Tax=Paenibacillus spongiae TaxID=2909671 RepID=A0ABY5S5Z8_9BACL|nr:hypothetical protein [Paenibacillus spongiae]UVI29327.1 hypothetical protein L1F29_28510 [Paenibacillus spongiae]